VYRQDRPFVDPAVARGFLYATAERLAQRTGALGRARRTGRHVADVIAELAATQGRPRAGGVVVDLGCGRGTTTKTLAERLPRARLVAVDIAPAMLLATRARLADHQARVRFVCGDFHRLPLQDAAVDLVVAAFCLYHSAQPELVLREIARCVAPGGTTILVTKSADSYAALDQLVAASGLDPAATTRPSLYATAHSGNLPELTAGVLEVDQVLHEEHQFRFADLAHLAEYLATSPKYHLPERLRGDHQALAIALRARLPDRPVSTASTVTFVLAHRPEAEELG
jgi:SAM-dependent methyltransferase